MFVSCVATGLAAGIFRSCAQIVGKPRREDPIRTRQPGSPWVGRKFCGVSLALASGARESVSSGQARVETAALGSNGADSSLVMHGLIGETLRAALAARPRAAVPT